MSGVSDSGPSEPRPSLIFVVAAEVATFYDVFGFLGIPMVVVFFLSAAWTFTLAVIQANANAMANKIMNTTNFDKGEFWLLPEPEPAIIVSSVVLLALFGIGYTALAINMLFFYRSRHPNEENQAQTNASYLKEEAVQQPTAEAVVTKRVPRNTFDRLIIWMQDWPVDVRQHYYNQEHTLSGQTLRILQPTSLIWPLLENYELSKSLTVLSPNCQKS
ncbi:uncharacterized protein KRP23_11716 [Phytophthora ramorum]|uniref:uncharacterized protein n=1 Tax=Phytophthora ramorum TaxID=164328 RepID=UPI003095FFC4|nr:hypothetical protein KRP23_11716 [Phytophthora ramorum]